MITRIISLSYAHPVLGLWQVQQRAVVPVGVEGDEGGLPGTVQHQEVGVVCCVGQ